MADEVHLGFEVGAGEPVGIPIAHMVATGMTQQAGKTTTLEALIVRSGLRAVTFVTKRGEKSFAGGRRIRPFFREKADWVFVSSLIDATLGEKNKLLRAWLMKVCRGTKTLAEVQRNVIDAKGSARGFAESIYTEIEGYLELVVPQIKTLPPSRGVVIGDGLNVMDLSPYSTELQALVIKSVLEHVYEHETGVITVIPEAWEFLPEGRGSPVKREAESLIRKGAGIHNFVWLDSQDLAGVMKLAVRAAPVYLIGVQREANEIKRTLANIPGTVAKPKAADVALLEKGQFFACYGKHCIKTYVQPAWMGTATAIAVARGAPLPTASICGPRPPAETLKALATAADAAAAELTHNSEEDFLMSSAAEQKLDEILEFLKRGAAAQTAAIEAGASSPSSAPPPALSTAPIDEEALYQRFKARLTKDAPSILKVLTAKLEIQLEERIEKIEIDGKSAEGRLARLIADGFFDSKRGASEATTEVNRRGGNFERITVYKAIEQLCEKGFLYREKQSDRTIVYLAVDGVKSNIVRA